MAVDATVLNTLTASSTSRRSAFGASCAWTSTWQPEFFINYNVPRAHGMAYDRHDNSVWLVTGMQDGSAGLIQYDAATGRTLSTAQFAKTDCDPHGLAWYNGALYSSDAGIHPGWADDASPTHGYIFRIDFN